MTQHVERDPRRARRAASRRSCWSTTSSRASRSSTPTPPSTSRSRPATPPRSPPGCATPARSSSARTRRSRSATTAPAPTTCCPPAAAPATPRACRCRPSCAVHVVDYDRDALREVAGHVVALAEAEDLPGHGAAVTRPPRRGREPPWTALPLRDELRGLEPYGAPQLDVPGAAQRQREPLPAVGGRRRRRRGGGRARDGDAQPLPRPRRARAARRPGRLPRRTASSRAAGVGGQRLQRGDAAAAAGLRRPGPHRAGLRADVLDVPRVRPRHRHRLGRRARDGRLRARPRPGPRAIEERRPDVVLLASPNNPTGTALPPEAVAALCEAVGQRRAWSSSTRRTPSSGAPAPRARSSCCPGTRDLVVTRTMSKAFALAGARLGYLAADPAVVDAVRSCACPTTCRRSPRRSRGPRSRTPPSCSARSTGCARSATRPWPGCASRG